MKYGKIKFFRGDKQKIIKKIEDKGDTVNKKSKVLKDLFSLQSDENILRIIRSLNLEIRGFSNISLVTIKNQRAYIISNFATDRNIKKIDKYTRSQIKLDEKNFDFLLEPKKIVEKYKDDFFEIATLFERDGYNKLPNNYFEIWNGKKEVAETNLKSENFKESNNLKTLREIIKRLEEESTNKQQKIDRLIQEKNKLSEEKYLLEKQKKEIGEKFKENVRDNDSAKLEINELRNKINESEEIIELILNKNKRLINDNRELNNRPHIKIQIIGLNEIKKKRVKESIYLYNNKEVDFFIENAKSDMAIVSFYDKNNLTSYSLKKIKNNTNATEISDEFLKTILKGES